MVRPALRVMSMVKACRGTVDAQVGGIDAQRVAVVGGDDLELVAGGCVEHIDQGLVDDVTDQAAT
jgi:hypothetical protein